GCKATSSVTINEPDTLEFTSINVTNVSCNAGNDGAIDIELQGGTQAYSYSWSSSALTQDVSSLSAGNYNVIVTDKNGCTAQASRTITEPQAMVITSNITVVSCFAGNDGGIDVGVTGGTQPYGYSWNHGPNTQDVNGLTSGNYKLEVTDDNGCNAQLSEYVDEPDLLVASIVSSDSVICNGESNGVADLSVAGGNGGYIFNWSNGAAIEDLSNVPAGTYTVLVTDSKDCTDTTSVTIGEPEALVIIRILKGKTCPGINDGWIDVQVFGGIVPYTYSWSNGQNTQLINQLYAGTFTVTAIDKNGCVAVEQSIDVENYPGMTTAFEADPKEQSFLNPIIDFIDLSDDTSAAIDSWSWDFGDGATDNDQHPEHEYADTGKFGVTLIVINEFGCADTTIDTVSIISETIIYIPNAFTPDGDGINEGWGVKGVSMEEFELYVYNRWGEMIFKTNDPNDLWNGRKFNSGELSPDGVYPYLVLLKDVYGKRKRFVGHVTLLK
ncbi:MAG: gliding motility-associated C-terminal domain-containing protein, partial [Bacteroidia bacterium]|nr:gliding motility-associated C-terminal domain-containing protein [Bacteroidia bacterium]